MDTRELAMNAEERATGYLKRWLADPEFRAMLHRFARKADEPAPNEWKPIV